MKKTAFITSIEKDGESFVRAFWTRSEAVEECEGEYNHMTDYDRKGTSFCVYYQSAETLGESLENFGNEVENLYYIGACLTVYEKPEKVEGGYKMIASDQRGNFYELFYKGDELDDIDEEEPDSVKVLYECPDKGRDVKEYIDSVCWRF